MKLWPVPNSKSKNIPIKNSPGSFWEDRGDRFHCGIDIYASEGSEVLSIEDGVVIETGVFTSPDINSYWNKTFYIIVKTGNDLFCKYAELGEVNVDSNEFVSSGQVLGKIGCVLNSEKNNNNCPEYIQKIKKYGNCSMLHFELYKSIPIKNNLYLGGNWFSKNKPNHLLNPTKYITTI